MALQPNSTFGNYRIGDAIGEGGMGQVFLATDTTLDRKVAIKVLPDSFSQDSDRVARFEREAKTLASLNHNNIAQIYGIEKAVGVGAADSSVPITTIVMELVEGPTLAERLEQGPLPPDEALRIARQIIDGLEAAHNKGIVHRDLKPANIKVTADGLVKILDFGIAKSIDVQQSSGRHTPTRVTPAVTETGVIMGTAAYMSPEQARGKFVDQRTDIWAFGCVLYEMLSGQPAFAGEDVAETLARIITLAAPTDSLPGFISSGVRQAITLCLQKDLKKRLADIRDVRLVLAGEFGANAAVALHQQQAKPALWRSILSHAVAVLVAAGGTAYFFFEPATEAVVADVRRSTQVLPQDQALTFATLPAISLAADDSKLVYGANSALYIRDMDDLEPRLVAGTDGEFALVPNLSPDGQWILYAQGTNNVKKISVEGGTPLPVLPFLPSNGFNWVDSNTIIYGNENELWTVTADGGSPQLLFTDEPGYDVTSPSFIPGTGLVLFQRRSPDASASDIAIYSTTSSELSILFPGYSPNYLAPGYLVYFDNALGLLGRTLDPQTLAVGSPIVMVDDILRAERTAGGPQFRVSSKGSLLYVKGAVNAEGGDIVAVGDEERMLEELPVGGRGSYRFPAVSPDGKQVAMNDATQIYIYNLDGSSEIRQLTREGLNIHPTWTPDGQYITYSSDRDGTRRIWQQRADGSGVAQALTTGIPARPQVFPAWAPDGRLTYNSPNEGGKDDIWIVSIPLGEPEVLVGSSADEFMAKFSADGRALVYGSDESGIAQVYVAPFPPDGSSTQISVSGVQSGHPIWSKQDSTVYFQHAGAPGVRISAVDVAIPGFALSNRRTLPYIASSDARRLDSIPGSNQLLLALPGGPNGVGSATNTELIFVENWVEELKKRVPQGR